MLVEKILLAKLCKWTVKLKNLTNVFIYRFQDEVSELHVALHAKSKMIIFMSGLFLFFYRMITAPGLPAFFLFLNFTRTGPLLF